MHEYTSPIQDAMKALLGGFWGDVLYRQNKGEDEE